MTCFNMQMLYSVLYSNTLRVVYRSKEDRYRFNESAKDLSGIDYKIIHQEQDIFTSFVCLTHVVE